MIYFIGGTTRSGKSTLAKILLERKKIPFISTDFLDCFIENEEYGIDYPRGNSLESYTNKSKQFYSVLKKLVLLIRGTNKELPYTIEGDLFTPEEISMLIQDEDVIKKVEIKACFLGFSKITNIQREMYLSSHSWVRKLSNEKICELERVMIEHSLYNREQCEKYNIPFFDTSENYESSLNEALQFLTT